MKILLVMDPGIQVPPKGYGGIERIVASLAIEYKNLGHDVHILATIGSYVDGCVMHSIGKEGFPPKKSEMNKAIFRAWQFIWLNRNKFDLIHNFGRLLYLLPVLNHRIKKIMSYQREITKSNIEIFMKLPNKNLFFTGCSKDLIDRANVPGNWTAIHNAIDFSKFTLNEKYEDEAPLIFLGRIERVKGCHTAIRVAKETNHKLIIAGNISKLSEEIEYYEKEIKPLIDNKQIIFIGEVNNQQKNEWLGKSKALLMPIEWNEPFGIVMIEAMACGTPVIGYNKGSVNEVVEERITGFKVDNVLDMINAIKKLRKINKVLCRDYAKNIFHINFIAKNYLLIK